MKLFSWSSSSSSIQSTITSKFHAAISWEDESNNEAVSVSEFLLENFSFFFMSFIRSYQKILLRLFLWKRSIEEWLAIGCLTRKLKIQFSASNEKLSSHVNISKSSYHNEKVEWKKIKREKLLKSWSFSLVLRDNKKKVQMKNFHSSLDRVWREKAWKNFLVNENEWKVFV